MLRVGREMLGRGFEINSVGEYVVVSRDYICVSICVSPFYLAGTVIVLRSTIRSTFSLDNRYVSDTKDIFLSNSAIGILFIRSRTLDKHHES